MVSKTAITLSAIQELMRDRFEVERCLVIAPLMVARDTWTREVEKWDHLQGLRVAKVLGPRTNRIRALEEDADIWVINCEMVVWLVEYFEQQRRPWPFDAVVIDELSRFKSSDSKRFRALRRVRPMMRRVIGLTGTPAANGLMDLWAQMYLLDRGERLLPTITQYRQTYFRPAYGNGYITYKWTPRRGALEQITEKIKDITVSMRSEDYLQLPDLIETTVGVELDPGALKVYRSMEQDALIQIDGEEVAAFDAAAVMSKLLQLASGFIYREDKEAREFHLAKLEALMEIAEATDEALLVFYQFREDRRRLLEMFEGVRSARTLESAEDIAAWNRGEVGALIAHPASAGFGLNLQDGGHVIVWYGLPWSLELYQQATGRLHRQGQQMPVRVYHLIANGTVDEQVERALRAKDMTQTALLKVLRERRGA